MEMYIDIQISSTTSNVNLDNVLDKKGTMHKIGDKAKNGIILDYSQWNFSYKPIKTDEINDVVTEFFNEIYKVKDSLIEYIKKTNSDLLLYIVIKNYEDEYLYLNLSKENIKKLSEIDASISVDGL